MSSYGIIHLSVIPVRAEPSDKSEMVTQGLFGEVFTILENDETQKWIKVKFEHDHYIGWIDSKQYKKISQTYFEDYTSFDQIFTTEGITIVSNNNGSFPLVAGSFLPFFNDTNQVLIGDEIIEVHTPIDLDKSEHGKLDTLILRCYMYLNAPYLWGGRTYFGIDCSGFVQQAFRQINLFLPRDAKDQAQLGQTIDFENRAVGDVAFFENDKKHITHVGIVLEDNEIIHASGEVRLDILKEQGIFHAETAKQTHKLSQIKRMI